MLVKIALFALAAFSATTTVSGWGTQNLCTTGTAQCCQNVVPGSSPEAKSILGPLGILDDLVNVAVGITCSPLVGSLCVAQPVCCDKVEQNGLINIGCTPISL